MIAVEEKPRRAVVTDEPHSCVGASIGLGIVIIILIILAIYGVPHLWGGGY